MLLGDPSEVGIEGVEALLVPDAASIDDAAETEIEALLEGEIDLAQPQNIGRAKRIDDGLGRYVEYAKTTFPGRGKLSGLKVVIDQVWSHTALEHPWFQASRESRDNAKSDWYVWADAKPDGSAPTNWQSWMGCPTWSWDSRRQQYYLHNFLPQMPDLNFHCPAVQDAVLGG